MNTGSNNIFIKRRTIMHKKILGLLTAAVTAISSVVFSINGQCEGSIKGDLNNDNIVSYVDLKILSDYLLKKNEDIQGNADINNDGKINVFDLILLKRSLLSFDDYTGFIKTDGRLLTDEKGEQYVIKGMAFGNNVWSNPAVAPENIHHTEDSYKELAELGFNSVRFYINYGLFESDSKPYVYNESGFEWLDKNIEQAKKYGIRLLLNMHYPQGGYQSQGNGCELWMNEENQKRLTALWTEIAERYKNEPAILGYGLVNEPVVAIKTTAEDCLDQWQELAQTITDRIRTKDKNHMIFIERMCAAKDTISGQSKWENFNDCNNYVKINDDNIVYEFHFYDPHSFTHQGFSWAGTSNASVMYPDESVVMAGNTKWITATFNGEKADISNEGWQYLESSFMTIDNNDYKVLSLVFQGQNLGRNGVVYVDNLKLDEYDENDKFIKTIFMDDFNKDNGFYYWSNDGSGIGYISNDVGYDDNRSLCISGSTDDASFGKSNFKAVDGHKYRASGYFKVENAEKNAVIRPRVDVLNADYVYSFDKTFLEAGILSNIQFSIAENVPVYCGEFGAGINCFKNDRGGEQWVWDVIDIFLDNDISFNYHTYHEDSFGMYTNNAGSPPDKLNEKLYSIFKIKLKSDL